VTGSKTEAASTTGGAVRKQMIKKRYEEEEKKISDRWRKEQMHKKTKQE